jgi:hypothetical protein
LAIKHHGAFVCLSCVTASFPHSINGVKSHYESTYNKDYKANKNAWDNKFKLMANLLKKNQLEKN